MPPKSSIGRAIVVTAFAVLTGYSFFAVVGSMLRDLYGKPPPPAESGLGDAGRAWCARRIRGLKNDIESRATQFLQKPDAALQARWEHSHEVWLRDYEEARGRCAAQDATLAAAFERLDELNRIYTEAVGGVMRARTGVSDELNDLLQRL